MPRYRPKPEDNLRGRVAEAVYHARIREGHDIITWLEHSNEWVVHQRLKGPSRYSGEGEGIHAMMCSHKTRDVSMLIRGPKAEDSGDWELQRYDGKGGLYAKFTGFGKAALMEALHKCL